MTTRFDRHEATAEARFERLEDQADDSVRAEAAAEANSDESWGIAPEELADGMHITDGQDSELPDEVEEHAIVQGDAVMDALAEAFNARDLERILELCRSDCEVPGLSSAMSEVEPALADLWERRPTVTLTRVVDDGHAVGVLWERIASERWAFVGTVHADVRGERVAVLEFSDDVALLDRLATVPPDGEDPMWDDLDGLDDTPE